jgi:general secretion pathway protein L
MAERNTAVFQWDRAGGRARWVCGRKLQEGDLSALAASGADEFVWLVDARGLQLAEVELPAASRRAQAQALPYALEDQLLAPVEQLAFATRRLSPTRLACAVFDGVALETGLATLAAAGIEVAHAVPDALCTPREDDCWTLLVDEAEAFLRTGQHAACRFPLAHWRAFVGQALAGAGDERRERLRVIAGSEALAAQLAAEFPALVVSNEPERRRCVRLLASGFERGPTLDLLEALPDRRRAGGGGAVRWWLASAAVLAAVAIGHAAFLGWHVSTLESRVETARAATRATFGELFPQITRVEDVRVQALQALAELDDGRGATPFLDTFASAAAALPADATPRLEHLGYGNGALEMRVVARDMAALESYQQALAAARLGVRLMSVESRDGGAVGLLRIGGAGD